MRMPLRQLLGVVMLLAANPAAGEESAPPEVVAQPVAQAPAVAAPEKVVHADQPRVQIGARVHTRYLFTDTAPHQEFELRRARLMLEVAPVSFLSGELDVDVAEVPAVKDAFADIAALPWLHLVTGQFKKPFSRVELLSSGKLPLWSRGIVTKRIAGNYGFGGRDVGAMVRAEHDRAALEVGAFNGTRTSPEVDSAKDIAARLEFLGGKSFDVGASGSVLNKNPEGTAQDPWHLWAVGLDGRLRIGVIDATVEALYAQEPIPIGSRDQLGIVAWLVVRTPRLLGVSIRPIGKFELLDDNVDAGGDHAVDLLGGINLDFQAPIRLFVQYDQVLPEKNSSELKARSVVIQLAIDWKTDLLTGSPALE